MEAGAHLVSDQWLSCRCTGKHKKIVGETFPQRDRKAFVRESLNSSSRALKVLTSKLKQDLGLYRCRLRTLTVKECLRNPGKDIRVLIRVI
ncbi:hypothetical protein ILYODFUR_034691 [Ilyodon furcidens]|uniref:Immunoglobulin V-set domain-containing protein n=1 Tax=Ilyodon furcidens TaxID=33524 RepID=A0ABV0VL22_9TELE